MDNSAEKPQRRPRGILNGIIILVPIALFAVVGIMLYSQPLLTSSQDTVTAPLVLPTADAAIAATMSQLVEADADAVVAEAEGDVAVAVGEGGDSAETTPLTQDSEQPADAINRLVIVTTDNQLVTVAPDGSDRRELTQRSDSVAYLFPAWSPSGPQIAAIGAGRRSEPSGIYVFDDKVDTEGERIFSDTQTPIYLYWTPDGKAVTFITTRTEDSSLLDFRIAPSDGSDRSRFLAFGAPFFWDFESTSDAILFSTNRTTHAEFAYIDPTEGEIGDEIADASQLFQSPDISFDDSFIAYGSGEAGARELVIENRVDGTRSTTDHLGGIAFSWSPTGNQLAYAAAERPSPRPYGPLRLMGTDGDVADLVDDAVVAFFWSPDGTKIAYLTVGSLGGGPDANASRTQLASLAQQERELQMELWVIDVNSSEKQLLGSFTPSTQILLQFLPFYDQYARSHSIWAPDSSAVVMPIRNDDGNPIVFTFGLDGSRPVEIGPGQAAFWSRK